MKNNNARRIHIQLALAPAINEALSKVEGLDLSLPEHQRRLMRALVHVGSGMLLDMGVPPANLAAACVEALNREVASFTSQFDEAPEGAPKFLQPHADA